MIAVQLVEGDIPVAVLVGAAVTQPGDQVAGEGHLAARLVALERVLGGIRGGEHGPAAAVE
ncbi:hypothetical protein [Actinocrispum sp. NPDC049592]|uniref:hypothetical protein n=1 Tax=Actinocrispum sp. NPDC049592 TaxID=3154835 RepID=UPI003436C1E4